MLVILTIIYYLCIVETIYNAPDNFNKLTNNLYGLLVKCASLRNTLGFIGFILTIVLGYTIVIPISLILTILIIHPIDYVLTKLIHTIKYSLETDNGVYHLLAHLLIITSFIPLIIFYLPKLIIHSLNKRKRRVEHVVEETIRVESQRVRDIRRRVDELNRIIQALPVKDFKPIHNIKRHRFISPDINTDLGVLPLGNYSIAIGTRALTTAGTNNFITMSNYVPGNYMAGIDSSLITNPNTLIH